MARRNNHCTVNSPARRSTYCLALILGILISASADAATLSLIPARSETGQGEKLSVSVNITGAADLFSAPFYIKYDPRHLKVVSVKQGDFLKQGGVNTAFLHRERTPGMVMVGLSRLGNRSGVNGSGTLATLTFITLGAGHTVISLSKSDLKDSQLAPAKVRIENTTIAIRSALGGQVK